MLKVKEHLYELGFNDADGTPFDMEKLKEKVVIIVNTASECGFAEQFEALEHLYRKYNDEGLVILGFPSDDFRNQEPLDAKEAEQYYRARHNITFPIMEKVHVRGKDIHPIFQYLTESQSGFFTNKVKWNFTKFLISREGKVVDRFAPQKPPDQFEDEIKAQLSG